MGTIGLSVLENIFGNFVNILTNGIKDVIDKKLIEQAFYDCGDVISEFENTGEDTFGESVSLVFSRDNLQQIYYKLKREKGYDYNHFLRRQLGKICTEYDIEADHFIDAFVQMFEKCIYTYDRILADEMYLGDWREENRGQYLAISSQINVLTEMLSDWNQSENPTFPLDLFHDRNQDSSDTLVEDEESLVWELKSPSGKWEWTNAEEKKTDLLLLTKCWREERLKAPSWYVVPENKRSILRLYTKNEELLYITDNVSTEELFDFAYELIWRYETGFMSYTGKLLAEIRKIWNLVKNQRDCFSSDSERKAQWFFIGQALLRDYREDLDVENWNEVYKVLWDNRSCISTGEAELLLEKIKLLFMQMKITDTRDRLNTFRCDSSAAGVRLQIAGLKAECGLFAESLNDLESLEKDLLYQIQKDENKCNRVQYKSLLAGTYFLQSFVLQAQKPFQCKEELQKIWDKQHEYERYFDFNHERQVFGLNLYHSFQKKDKSEPFDLYREERTIFFGNPELSESYDFYRLLDRMAFPLHIGYTRLLADDESDFIRVLLEQYQCLGWQMLLRFGSTKTTQKVLSRKECMILNNDGDRRLKKAFDYVYQAVDGNIGSMQAFANQHMGNAYGHILMNGLEILQRLSVTTNMAGQKKLISLMCKLIDTDVVKEYRVLDKWISQIMHVTDDRVKAAMLNEMLVCSAKERTHLDGERTLDPFDVFYGHEQTVHMYQEADIDPDVIDRMLERSSVSMEEKKHFVPRLGQLAEWNLLSHEQSEAFGALLWEDIDEENILPYGDEYLPHVFLKWPHPEAVDPVMQIKKRLLNPENFILMKNKELSSITFGESIFLQNIKDLNRNAHEFWHLDDVEYLLCGFVDYWKSLNQKYISAKHPDFYKEEFTSRVKTLVYTMVSFDRNQVQQMNSSIIQEVQDMINTMNACGIETMALSAMVVSDDGLEQLSKDIIKGLVSADGGKVNASVCAAEIVLYNDVDSTVGQNIINEIVKLCLYKKEPGLKNFLNVLHNVLYSRKDIILSTGTLDWLKDVLDNIDEHTKYADNIHNTEKAIKNIIRVRVCCANLAYQLYTYEKMNNMDHSAAVLNWKDICRGKKSMEEFSEVKRCWLE